MHHDVKELDLDPGDESWRADEPRTNSSADKCCAIAPAECPGTNSTPVSVGTLTLR